MAIDNAQFEKFYSTYQGNAGALPWHQGTGARDFWNSPAGLVLDPLNFFSKRELGDPKDMQPRPGESFNQWKDRMGRLYGANAIKAIEQAGINEKSSDFAPEPETPEDKLAREREDSAARAKRFADAMMQPFNPNDPQHAALLSNVQSRVSRMAQLQGVRGGLANTSTKAALANAGLGIQNQRNQLGLQALGMGLQSDQQALALRQRQYEYDQMRNDQLLAQMNAQGLADAQASGAKIGTLGGAIVGGYLGGPMGAQQGASVGGQLGAGLSGSSYQPLTNYGGGGLSSYGRGGGRGGNYGGGF